MASQAKLEENNNRLQDLEDRIETLKNPDTMNEAAENLLGEEINAHEKKLNQLAKAIEYHDEHKPDLRNYANVGDFNKAVKEYNKQARILLDQKNDLTTEIRDLRKTKKDPDLLSEWAESKLEELEGKKEAFLEAQEKLQNNVDLQKAKLQPFVRGIRDKCQSLANNPSVSDEELASQCGVFFDKNNPNLPGLKTFGIEPIKVPKGRVTDPFDWGKPPVQIVPGDKNKSGFQQAPSWWVPPVGPSGPVDEEE